MKHVLIALLIAGCTAPDPEPIQPIAHAPPGFWGVTPCQQLRDELDDGATTFDINLTIMTIASAGWLALCDGHADEEAREACRGYVRVIEADLQVAVSDYFVARQLSSQIMLHAYDAMDIADDIALGAGGALADHRDEVIRLATIMVTVASLRQAIATQADVINDLISGAIATTSIDSFLYPMVASIAPAELAAQEWRSDAVAAADCYQRVTTWIAVGAAVGFGVRILVWPPGLPGGGALVAPHQSGTSELLAGFYNPHSMAHYASHPIIIDLDALTSAQRAATRQEGNGGVYHSVFAGYDQPHTTFPADVIVPDPWFLLPTVAVPAGSTLRLVGGPAAAGTLPSFEVVGNSVHLQGVGVHLNWQATDATGQPIHPFWASCAPGSIDGEYCPLGLDTTGSPAEVAAGTVKSAYWRIHATGGIIDPATGYPTEPLAGYLLGIRGRAERPSDPCYVWTGARYEYNHLLPGCGPIGWEGEP